MRPLNHVAVVVRSIENFIKENNISEDFIGDIDTFEAEGTREVYIGEQASSAKLLLMQPIAPGPYKRALQTKGEGIHHIALEVLDIADFLGNMEGSGWAVHVKSWNLYKNTKTIFLVRAKEKVLVEIMEVKKLSSGSPFITELGINFSEERLLESLKCNLLNKNYSNYINISGKVIKWS